ncbi:MAG: hypothetical protein WAV72_25795 [Bradyrhizobium sp.]
MTTPMPSHWTPSPEEEMSPKGPERALEEAVGLLAPFELHLIKRRSLDGSDIKAFDAQMIARANVHHLAEYLNSALYRARHAPRVKEMAVGLMESRDLLRKAAAAVASLDDWSRFHLMNRSELSFDAVKPHWLPPYGSIEPGEFVKLSLEIADQIDDVITKLRAMYGGKQAIDQGGKHSHEERFLGTAKTRFVQEAFEIFDSYHPRTATSADGSPFHTFVHRVYEFATGDYDEDSVTLSYKLRELITALHQFKETQRELWAIDEQLDTVAPDSAEYFQLCEQQKEVSRRQSELRRIFIPNLGRATKIGQPRQKKPR